jgi:hypothetical protein
VVVGRKVERHLGHFFEQFIERGRVGSRGNLVAVAAPDIRFIAQIADTVKITGLAMSPNSEWQ